MYYDKIINLNIKLTQHNIEHYIKLLNYNITSFTDEVSYQYQTKYGHFSFYDKKNHFHIIRKRKIIKYKNKVLCTS